MVKVLKRVKTRTSFEYCDLRLTDEGNRLMVYALQGGSRPRNSAPLYEQQRMDTTPRS